MPKPKPTEEPKEVQVVRPFSPKEQYQKYQSDSARALQDVTNSKWLRVSLDAALAQLAAIGADNRELRGARRLIEILLELPEKDTPTSSIPPITLEILDS